MLLEWLHFGVVLVGMSVQLTLAVLLWPWFKERRAEGKEKTTKRMVDEHQVREILKGTGAAALLDKPRRTAPGAAPFRQRPTIREFRKPPQPKGTAPRLPKTRPIDKQE